MLVRSARSVAIAGLSCAATWSAGGGCGPGSAGPHEGSAHAAKPAASNTNDERLAEFFMGVLLIPSARTRSRDQYRACARKVLASAALDLRPDASLVSSVVKALDEMRSSPECL